MVGVRWSEGRTSSRRAAEISVVSHFLPITILFGYAATLAWSALVAVAVLLALSVFMSAGLFRYYESIRGREEMTRLREYQERRRRPPSN
jgi:hypothetical protein